MLLGLEEW